MSPTAQDRAVDARAVDWRRRPRRRQRRSATEQEVGAGKAGDQQVDERVLEPARGVFHRRPRRQHRDRHDDDGRSGRQGVPGDQPRRQGRAEQADGDRGQVQLTRDESKRREDQDPERMRRRLRTFGCVPGEPITGDQVLDRAEGHHAVVTDPAGGQGRRADCRRAQQAAASGWTVEGRVRHDYWCDGQEQGEAPGSFWDPLKATLMTREPLSRCRWPASCVLGPGGVIRSRRIARQCKPIDEAVEVFDCSWPAGQRGCRSPSRPRGRWGGPRPAHGSTSRAARRAHGRGRIRGAGSDSLCRALPSPT